MVIQHLISIVGAGPGDPDLLTVKALRCIAAADVILYDALMEQDVLKLASTDALMIYVGKLYKDGQDQTERQGEIHKLFLTYAQQNKKVVRLKAGDPMIFGRGAEEIRFCKEHELSYEVIPGITAGIAASCLFDLPLTERGKNSMLLFYTGHRVDGSFSDLKAIVEVLQTGSPAVIYMGLNNLPDMATELINKGISELMPVHILSRISQSQQQSYSSTLGGVVPLLELEKPKTPSIIIVGENTIL